MTITAPEARTVFICAYPDCGKRFESNMALKAHEGSHKNRGTFTCPECLARGETNTFSLPQHLAIHRKRAHGVESQSKKAQQRRAKAADDKAEKVNKAERAVDAPFAQPTMRPPTTSFPRQTFPMPVPPRRGPLAQPEVEVGSLIMKSMEPLIERYKGLQEKRESLIEEERKTAADLMELWGVLHILKERESTIQIDPPSTNGVLMVPPAEQMQPFVEINPLRGRQTKGLSPELFDRGVNWCKNRGAPFTVVQFEKGLGVAHSTGQRMTAEMREKGIIRLLGVKPGGRAKLYLYASKGA